MQAEIQRIISHFDMLEHPEGAIDLTLIEKTVTPYKKNMFVIAAPKALYFMPEITATTIGNLLYILRKRFKYVVLDLAHGWTPWLHAILREPFHADFDDIPRLQE